jgi:hypothetical protein
MYTRKEEENKAVKACLYSRHLSLGWRGRIQIQTANQEKEKRRENEHTYIIYMHSADFPHHVR